MIACFHFPPGVIQQVKSKINAYDTKQNETLAQEAFMDCDVMPRDKFVYVVERGFTSLSHCFLSAHASTVCSCRV